jgi:hypothetical protein
MATLYLITYFWDLGQWGTGTAMAMPLSGIKYQALPQAQMGVLLKSKLGH